MIDFLAEWLVTFLIPATHVLEVRAPHLSFMFLKEYWFRELYLGLKVTASFDRSESYTRVIDGQVRCITPEIKPQNLQVIWNVQFITVFCARMDDPSCLPQPAQGKHQEREFRQCNTLEALHCKTRLGARFWPKTGSCCRVQKLGLACLGFSVCVCVAFCLSLSFSVFVYRKSAL